MTELWKGMFKVQEEAGEVLQLLGKLGPFPVGDHPDGKGPVSLRLRDEIADLYAALDYFCAQNFGGELNTFDIGARRANKRLKYDRWGLTGITVGEEPLYSDKYVKQTTPP